jgi:hypothetical protein
MPDLVLRLEDGDGTDEYRSLSEDQALALLQRAEITSARLIPWGSNYTFGVVLIDDDESEHIAIYKPRAGESPLYDFPDGTLYRREVSAYHVSRFLGWDLVPPTTIREGPHGIGSLQMYVEPSPDAEDPSQFWSQCLPAIERLVLFDHITNNADRKLGHCLRDRHGKIWGIDHGLTFNTYPKLRTVLWQFVGDPISPPLLLDLERLCDSEADLRHQLMSLLSTAEINAFFARAAALTRSGSYPLLNGRKNVPWGWW